MATASFQFGIDVFLSELASRWRGARVGLVANRSCCLTDGTPVHTAIQRHPGLELAVIFTPEHGWNVDVQAGEEVPDRQLKEAGTSICSLYGDRRAPEVEALENLDLLLFDLPTLAVRCFTYGSTLYYCLKAAAAAGIPVVVTDRPVPLPFVVDGPMLEPETLSFISLLPVPLAYSLTAAELAAYLIARERWSAELLAVPMRHWRPESGWWPRKVTWRPPSPALRTPQCAFCYPATVWCEAFDQADCRRASEVAFQVLHWKGKAMERVQEKLGRGPIAGCRLESRGAELALSPAGDHRLRPVELAVHLICAFRDSIPAFWEACNKDHLTRLFGSSRTVKLLENGADPHEIISGWRQPLADFASAIRPFLQYPRSVHAHGGAGKDE